MDGEMVGMGRGRINVERVIDDFVFLCFFVGNDFLPHLPGMRIRMGAIDAVLQVYKEYLPSFDGYLTEEGDLNFPVLMLFLRHLARLE